MNLAHQFLIAMPALAESHFQNGLILVCEHDSNGAIGLLVNRPMAVTLRDVLQQLEIEPAATASFDQPVHYGGPVDTERGFIIHPPHPGWDESMAIGRDIALTSSRNALADMGHAQGPARTLLALGYAGWGPGQLEAEIADNAWLTCTATPEIVFEQPAEARLDAAAAHIGIDLAQLSGDAGHA